MTIDEQVFLQLLRECTLEEGRTYIQEYRSKFTDIAALGTLIKDEALRQRDIHPFTAIKLADLLLFFGEYTQHRVSHALGFIAKGDALSVLGHEEAAMDCFDAAAEEFLRLGDEVNWARTRIGWIISCAWLGRVEEALQGAARARAVFEQYHERYWVCVIEHNTAVIYSQIGHYQKALEIYDRILTIYPTLTDQSASFIQRAIALVQLNQGRNLSWLGDFAGARRLLSQARAGFMALEQIGLLNRTEDSLAQLDYVQGYYGSALRRYYQIRDSILQHNPSAAAQAWAISQIARCLVKLNRAAEARLLAAESVQIYREGGAVLDIGNALLEYAVTLIASNKRKEALENLTEAWMLFNQSGFLHHATAARLQQTELLLEMGSVLTAYEQASQLKDYFDQQGLVARAASVRLIMVGSLVSRARESQQLQVPEQRSQILAEAAALCAQTIALAQQYNLQEQSYKGLYLQGQIVLVQGRLAQAVSYYAAAIEQIEHILDDLVLDLRPAFLHTTWAVYEDMIALCLLLSRGEDAFRYLERARSLALRQYLTRSRHEPVEQHRSPTEVPVVALQAKNAEALRMRSELAEWQNRYHHYSTQLATMDTTAPPEVDRVVLESELRRCEAQVSELFERLHLQQIDVDHLTQQRPPTASMGETQALSADDIQHVREHLLPDQLLLTYFLYKGKLVIFAITKEQMLIHENADGLSQLERLLPPLYAHLEPRGWPDAHKPPLQIMCRLLQRLYTLLIAPVAALLPEESGTLTIVPYGLLHNLPFHALHNGTRFLIEDFQVNYLPATNMLAQPHSWKPAVETALIFGFSGHGDLPRALDEATALQEMLGGSCYLEEEATIERLVEQAPQRSIIHLATHGRCRLDAPNFSYIRLADGPLSAFDAFGLDLENCQLVTLSGCETGLALSGGGDEQLGLGRAFLAAGASSLVMSLWPVEDAATNELMLLFYRYLLDGESKVQALRFAQCSLLRRQSPDDSHYAHPYFWAAFRLVGASGPLQFSAQK